MQASIALTSVFDIQDGKALRKLEEGESLEPLEPVVQDDKRSLVRVKVKATRDGMEGYITLRGNQGTAFAEQTDKHYVCRRAVPLEVRLASGSNAVRMLEVGEAFESTEMPRVESKEGANRLRVRCPGDGSEGWLTLTSSVRAWLPKYKCVRTAVPLKDGEGRELRQLAQAELLEALDVPIFTDASGRAQVKVRAEKDSITGFVALRGDGGAAYLEPLMA